jgi:hypothetical protein
MIRIIFDETDRSINSQSRRSNPGFWAARTSHSRPLRGVTQNISKRERGVKCEPWSLWLVPKYTPKRLPAAGTLPE